MATSILSPSAKQQFFDNAGVLAAGYKLYTYAANTLTPRATYTDRAGLVSNTNPIVLDARGEAIIYLTPGIVYDYVLKTPADVTVWTREDVIADAGDATAVIFSQLGVDSLDRSVQNKLNEIPSILDKIPSSEHAAIRAGTSTFDCTTAIQQAVTDYPRCYAPQGEYLVTGTITLPAGHELHGAGMQAAYFKRSGANQSYFILGTNAVLTDIGFKRVGATTATSGRLISIGVSGCKVSNIYTDHCWDGIYVTSCAGLFLNRIYLNGWQNAAINVDGTTNDVLLDNFIFTSVGNTTAAGIKLFNKVEAFTASNGDIIGGGYPLSTGASAAFVPENRLNPNFNKFTNVYFDSSLNGVLLQKAALLDFVGCWFSATGGSDGVLVGECADVTFTSCDFFTNFGSGARLSNTAQKGTTFNGCRIHNNNEGNGGSNGITVDAGVSDWSVIGCMIGNTINAPTPGQGSGIFIAAGASDRYIIANNNFTGNTSSAVSDSGTGSAKRIGGNVGFDPPIIAPTLLGTWANLGGPHQTAGYWKDSDGTVHLTGVIQSGVIPSAVFTLPAGYRPAAQLLFCINSNGAIGRADIKTTGDVEISAGSGVFVSLCGISFKAA